MVKTSETKRLPCPLPSPKDQPVQAEVGGNLTTVSVLKSVQIALKAVGKMSLPPLGTVLSLNTSLNLRLRPAFWKICKLLQIHLEALYNSDEFSHLNYLVWSNYLEVTKFIKGRKTNSELPVHILKLCSPFRFSDT